MPRQHHLDADAAPVPRWRGDRRRTSCSVEASYFHDLSDVQRDVRHRVDARDHNVTKERAFGRPVDPPEGIAASDTQAALTRANTTPVQLLASVPSSASSAQMSR